MVGFTQQSNGAYVVTLSRYLPNGSLDTGYGNGGTTITNLPSPPNFYLPTSDLALQQDGSLLISSGKIRLHAIHQTAHSIQASATTASSHPTVSALRSLCLSARWQNLAGR